MCVCVCVCVCGGGGWVVCSKNKSFLIADTELEANTFHTSGKY